MLKDQISGLQKYCPKYKENIIMTTRPCPRPAHRAGNLYTQFSSVLRGHYYCKYVIVKYNESRD